uniref:Perlucin 5-like protein n=1 Tax=Acartia pacifica TaxID=335913 RepID=R9TFS9_ACAPC|nr:perlucin 5-like protein [Acartia pacifica]
MFGKLVTASACLLALLALAAAQDTHFCNDGWDLYTTTWHDQTHHSCFYFGTNFEKVSHDTAKLLCNGMGAFLAEVPYGPHLNSWIVQKLLEKNNLLDAEGKPDTRRPHFETQYWLGARDFGHHNEHVPGEWMWEHRNTTVQWFDWADNEPNNFHGQSCLTYLLEESIFGFRDFKWNDWDCNEVADFICEVVID